MKVLNWNANTGTIEGMSRDLLNKKEININMQVKYQLS